MAAAVFPLTFRFPVEALGSSRARGVAQHSVQIRTIGSSCRVDGPHSQQKGRRGAWLQICHAEGKSCCGGSGSESTGSGGKCSSHGSHNADVAGIGQEFDALVARKTMEEFESNYDTAQMEGTISRDVIDDVVGIVPEAAAKRTGEKFLDINELLAEARSMTVQGGDFVFDAEFEEMLV